MHTQQCQKWAETLHHAAHKAQHLRQSTQGTAAVHRQQRQEYLQRPYHV